MTAPLFRPNPGVPPPYSAREARPPNRLQMVLPAVLAAGLFIPLFFFKRAGPIDFWWWMSAAVVFLNVLGAVLDRGFLPSIARDFRSGVPAKIALGIFSAAVLYTVFFAGNAASNALFPFAGSDIGRIYGFKASASTFRVALLLALVIGPGEELFWRGYLQRHWQERLGSLRGFLGVSAFYALVHAASGNAMLILAAGVCGLFWGFLYMRTRSVLLVAVSHTAWDLAVFLFFPFA